MPKLTAEFERLACQQGAIEYVAHDRVPFFIVEGIPVIGEEEIECYSETYNGVQYVKMDSTHKNADGSYSGAEPTYSSSMNQERQALWAEQYELVTVDQMKELRRLDAMTAEQYRQHIAEELEEKKKPEHIEFIAPCKDGVVREFVVDLADIVDTSAQYQMLEDAKIPHMLIHDKYHQVIPPQYSFEQASPIIGIMMYVKKRIMLPVDKLLERIWALPEGFTKDDVDKAVSEPLTQSEEDAILVELLAGASDELIALIAQLYGTA